jgi:hypothetical protein
LPLECLFAVPSQTETHDFVKLKAIKHIGPELARSRKDLADAGERLDTSERKAQAGDMLEASLLPGHTVHLLEMLHAVQIVESKQAYCRHSNFYRRPRAEAMRMKGEQADCYATDSEEDESVA